MRPTSGEKPRIDEMVESCQSSSVASCVWGPTRLMPALLTTMSSQPKSFATASNAASTCALCATSVG
jgi:hypothetical protein